MNKNKRAVESFEICVLKDPRMTQAFAMIGQIRLQQKKYFKAMDAFKKARARRRPRARRARALSPCAWLCSRHASLRRAAAGVAAAAL